MTISVETQAILLLTVHFRKGESGAARPLTPKEYGRFAGWLRQQSLTPERLLSGDLADLLMSWHDKAVSVERIRDLLDRGSALALSMEKWGRSGLWVMTRSDPDYPRRLKQRLRGDSPAVLFGCGNRAHLNGRGLAVVGSRDVKEADLSYSGRIGALAATAGVSVVSGGARGVDEAAMLGALGAEGTAVGVLADSLLRACSSAKYRRYLLDNSLVLVSPFNPEAGFSAGNAMQRNKYIYCLSDGALAVHSGKKGGTWNGAREDLRKGWVPLWVKATDDPEAGNTALIAAGASEAPSDIAEVDISAFLDERPGTRRPDQRLFESRRTSTGERPSPEALDTDVVPAPAARRERGQQRTEEISLRNNVSGQAHQGSPPQPSALAKVSFYELFIEKAKELCAHRPLTPDDLADAMAVNKAQLNAWLKRAVERGELKKRVKPVRYELGSVEQGRLPL